MVTRIKSDHPWIFRCGEWATIIAVELRDGNGRQEIRPCYRVRFEDGVEDSWVIDDIDADYVYEGDVNPHIAIVKRADDPHPSPHMMLNGGCCCTCELCIKDVDNRDFFKCICPRCNEECPSIGRLGSNTAWEREHEADMMTVGKPAGIWWKEVKA